MTNEWELKSGKLLLVKVFWKLRGLARIKVIRDTNKKPGEEIRRVLVVDYTIQISNLDLAKGLREVVDILEHIEYSKLFV